MKKIYIALICLLLVFGLGSCTKEPVYDGVGTLSVKKVKNLSNDFILGMDASSVISEEASGVKYYDFDGNEADVFETLSKAGINYIRVRVWNDPYDSEGHGYGGGNCDLNTAIAIGKRATRYGMKLLVDFHYSDFWADPAKQQAPKAWEKYGVYTEKNRSTFICDYCYFGSWSSYTECQDCKCGALYEYTKTSLETLVSEGIDVGMVQIGNETTKGMAGETNIDAVCLLMNSASRAIRETTPNALIAIHLTNPEKAHNYINYAKSLADSQVDYDVFGTSYYPYWHGTLENLSNVLSTIATTYNKKTMVLETSYANTTEDTDGWGNTIGTAGYDAKQYPFTIAGQANHIRELVDTIANKTKNGIGVCYWEGTWISVGNNYESNQQKWEQFGSGWASSYSGEYDPNDAGKWYGGCAVDNQAFFDNEGKPLESLNVFKYLRTGNSVVPYIDGALDCDVTIATDDKKATLPKNCKVVMSDNSKVDVAVTWDAFDLDQARAAGNAKYTINGKCGDYDVQCLLTIMENNFVSNYSFEDGATNWTLNVNAGTLSSNHKVEVTAENPQTGKKAFHFWTSEDTGVNFDITQSIKVKNGGTYKLSASFLGGKGSGAMDASTIKSYLYITVNGQTSKLDVKMTSYNDGYKTFVLNDISIPAGTTVTIGVHMEVTDGNVWGDIDDVMFNFVGE